jgi:hypothetical protein
MAILDLLIADAAELVLEALIGPQWGLYLNGFPVIQPAKSFIGELSSRLAPLSAIAAAVGVPNLIPISASIVDFDFSQDWPLSNYPQEQGAFQSYDKVTLPFEVRMRIASGGPPPLRQAFLSSCLAIANSMALYDLVTPELVFPSCNCTRIEWRRSHDKGVTLLQVDLTFQQINVASAVAFGDTSVPQIAGQQSLGNVQPQTPLGSVVNKFTGAL